MKTTVNVRLVLMVVLTPLVLAGLFALGVQIQSLKRYDPAYFSAAYLQQYQTPGAVARTLEGGLQTGDQELIAELQGLRRPATFESNPKMIFIMLWKREERYISYLYLDMENLNRHTHYLEQVEGRWVVSPADMHYYLHSGRWLKLFLPLAIIWWLLGTIVILALWIYRLSARTRLQLYGG